MRKNLIRLFIAFELLCVLYALIKIDYQNNLLLNKPKEPFNFKLECAKTLQPYKEQLETLKQEKEQETRQKAFELLNNYVNKYSSNCYTTSIRFITELKGIEDYELVKIKESDVKCGDLIFYQRSSFGTNHYGVYLDNEISMQPNWTNHKIIIGQVHYDTFSKPIFYRVERKEK